MNTVINILAFFTLAAFAAWHIIEFYKHEWPLKKREEKKRMLSSEDYNNDYISIMSGIHKSIHLSQLEKYAAMIYRFNKKYKNTSHAEGLDADTKVLLDVCKAKEDRISNYIPELN